MAKKVISQSKYKKFVEMTEAKEDVIKIRTQLKLTEYMYYKYFYTYIDNNKKEREKEKEIKVNHQNIPDGYSDWVSKILKVC